MAQTTPPQKNLTIIGGSYAGISTAHYLLKHVIPKLPDRSAYQVILISASSQALCRPACPRALLSDHYFDQDKLFVPIAESFSQYSKDSFRLIHGTATSVDQGSQIVSVSLSTDNVEKVSFYSLIIATGASTTSPLLGLNRDENHLRDSWKEFRKALPLAKTIIVAGGGPSGIETAGELGEHLNGRPGFFSSKAAQPNVTITVVTTGSQILPLLRPALAEKAERYLSEIGVTVVKNARVKTVLPPNAGSASVDEKATLTLEDGTILNADLYIPAMGFHANTSFLDPALLAPDGRIKTNPSTLRVDSSTPRIYALGDASNAARPAVHNIMAQVPIVCTNIRRDLQLAAGEPETDVEKERLFVEDKREMQLVPIGRSKGVGAAMGWWVPSAMVWAIKGRDYWLWMVGGLWTGAQWAKEK